MSLLVGSVCMGVADLISDAIAYARLRSGYTAVANEDYKAAYVAILSVAAVASTVDISYSLYNAHRVRAHVLGMSQPGRVVSASEAQRNVQQHEYELAQTQRTKVSLSLSLLTVVAQGAVP